MCGRYTITVTMDELMVRFFLDEPFAAYRPRYNAAPGQAIPIVLHDGNRLRMDEFRWGLIPFWAKDEKIGYRMINARAETVAEKPAYRASLQRKRCLIPADGFYEWKKTGKAKQPMRIVLQDRSIFGMAGLYDTWTSPDGRQVHSCTIITTDPNELVADVHDRMPVIIEPQNEALWLDPKVHDTDLLQGLLRPISAKKVRIYPVTPAVGNVKNDSPDCIRDIS